MIGGQWDKRRIARFKRLWAQQKASIPAAAWTWKPVVLTHPPTLKERADECIRDILAMTCRELQRTGRI